MKKKKNLNTEIATVYQYCNFLIKLIDKMRNEEIQEVWDDREGKGCDLCSSGVGEEEYMWDGMAVWREYLEDKMEKNVYQSNFVGS